MKKILAIALAALVKLSPAQINNGLVACYPLDCDRAANYASTGSALDGTTYNVSCATGHCCSERTAYQFAGNTSSYIELPSDSRIQGNVVCFSGWFYLDEVSPGGGLASEQYLVYTQNNCSYNFEAYSLVAFYDASISQYVFRVSKSDASCTYAPQVQSTSNFLSPSTSCDDWYHVVFYIDDSKMWLYVNNVLESSTTHNIVFDYNTAGLPVYLSGTNVSYWNWPFYGKMDDLRFYDRELTAAEIAYLYGRCSSCDDKTHVEGRSVGLQVNSAANTIKLYPNPSEGKFTVSGAAGNTFKITDISGKTISHKTTKAGNNTEVELLNAAPGFYFMNIFDAKGNYLQTQKIVVTK